VPWAFIKTLKAKYQKFLKVNPFMR